MLERSNFGYAQWRAAGRQNTIHAAGRQNTIHERRLSTAVLCVHSSSNPLTESQKAMKQNEIDVMVVDSRRASSSNIVGKLEKMTA